MTETLTKIIALAECIKSILGDTGDDEFRKTVEDSVFRIIREQKSQELNTAKDIVLKLQNEYNRVTLNGDTVIERYSMFPEDMYTVSVYRDGENHNDTCFMTFSKSELTDFLGGIKILDYKFSKVVPR